MFYIHEWSGENEPPGMNLCWIGCTLFKWLVNSEKRGSLWTKKPFFGSENFRQNKGTREKKKLRNVVNFLEIFVCINIPVTVTNVLSYSCRWVLRINLAARPVKGQIWSTVFFLIWRVNNCSDKRWSLCGQVLRYFRNISSPGHISPISRIMRPPSTLSRGRAGRYLTDKIRNASS